MYSLFKKYPKFVFLALLLGGISCKPENSPPEVILTINPLSGDAPLSVHVQLSGKDVDGPGDIISYSLTINENVLVQQQAIDTNIVFKNPGNYTISGVVTDSKNQNSNLLSKEIVVNEKAYLKQSLTLFDSLKISYKATLFRVSAANLTVFRTNNIFSNQLIYQIQINDINQSGPDYEIVYSSEDNYCMKGKYEFVLKSNNLTVRDTIEIPDYKPSLTKAIQGGDIIEDRGGSIVLPSISDKNPEDKSAVHYTNAKSPDNKTRTSFIWISTPQGDEYHLNFTGQPDCVGPYQIELEYGSTNGGLNKTVISGNIIPKMRINPFIQPNDSTLNWYGSGDVNNDNILNNQDLVRISELINGTFSNSSDLRLNDRSDVNGDGTVTVTDKQILDDRLNGRIQYLPGEWNKLPDRTEREDWLKKMLAIDQTSEMIPPPGWVCEQYSTQTYINFHGVCNPTDIKRILEETSYDMTNNGRFNIPMYCLAMVYPDIVGHAMNTVVVGNNILVWNDLCNIEPNNDVMNVMYSIALNPTFYIQGVPVFPHEYSQITWSCYCKYVVQNGILGEGIAVDDNNFLPIKVIKVRP